MKTIAVIGGGITGVRTAYALAKRGFATTLLEKHRCAAMETWFANGGQLPASNAGLGTDRFRMAGTAECNGVMRDIRVGQGTSPCVFYNTGHGHPGWPLSAVSADMIGDLMRRSLDFPTH